MIANGKFLVEKLIHDLIDADEVVEKGFDVLSDKGSDKMKILINPRDTVTTRRTRKRSNTRKR